MYVTVSCNGESLILPVPEFGNSESDLNTVKIQRSMVGGVYTVIKRRAIETFKIKWILARTQLKQLQDFLLKYSDKPYTYQDHHGELWVGYFYNDTFDSTEKEVWANEIDINFEGYRLT